MGPKNVRYSGQHKYFMQGNIRNEGQMRTESEACIQRPANLERRVETFPSDRLQKAATFLLQTFADRPTLREISGKLQAS